MNMWKLSHSYVSDCGERQTMSHIMTCGDASNCRWQDLAMTNPCRCQPCQTLGGVQLTVTIKDSMKKTESLDTSDSPVHEALPVVMKTVEDKQTDVGIMERFFLKAHNKHRLHTVVHWVK